MALIDSIVSYWSMDEDHEAGGTRYDKVASNHLTDTNTVLSASGKLGFASDFERSNTEHMQIAHASQSGLAITGDISISAWVSVESAFAANYVVCSKAHNSTSHGYTLLVFSDGAVQFDVKDGTNTSFGKTAASQIPANGTLKHIVATFDADGGGDKVKIYVDGSLVANATSGNSASSINTDTNPFSVGARSDKDSSVGNHWDGKIDELGVWSKVLSSTEVTELYNSGNGKQYPFGTILDTGFVAPTQIDDTGSHTAWTNKNNMMASDNSYATATANNTRNWARNFGFSIASDAVIHGFEFSVEAYESANNGTTVRVQLSPDGGSNSYGEVVAALGESDTGAATIGAPYQVMRRKWTGTELNNTNLRVVVFSANGGTHGTVSLDQIRMKVYYSLLAVDVSVSGTVVTATFSKQTPTVTGGATISPSAQSLVSSQPAESVVTSSIISAGVQSATFNPLSPTATGGATISPAAVAAIFSTPTPDVLTPDVSVPVGALGLTASLPSPAVNLDFLIAIAGTPAATFSQPAAAVQIGDIASPSALSASFSQPAIAGFVLGFTVSPSALSATFSKQTPSIFLLTQVDVGVVAATFSQPAVSFVLSSLLSPSALVATFTQPTLRLAGSVWRKTARNSTGSWTRSSRNST